MNLGHRFALRARSIGLLFALLVLAGFAAWASLTWSASMDWAYGHQASLTPASRELLAALDKPITITAFARPGTRIAQLERRLLERYRRADPDIRIRFVNPDTALDKVRELGITAVGQLYVRYGEHGVKLNDVSERGITNALLSLARGTGKRVVFITGHGEAGPRGQRNYDLGRFGAALERRGFRVATRNLAENPELDSDIALVVIAGPRLKLPPGEVRTLVQWLEHGGNLLWLRDPGPAHGLEPLARELGIETLAGTIVDTRSRGLGIEDPTAVVISDYGESALTRDFSLNTLFVDATGFRLTGQSEWKSQVFIAGRDFPTSWLMSGGPKQGRALYRPGIDVPGPLPIAIAFTRNGGEQRAAVVGDTSFLANRFLGNGGNLALGLKLVAWLTGEDRFLDIAPPRSPDRDLVLSTAEQAGIALGFLAFLPFVFLATAGTLAWRRRRR